MEDTFDVQTIQFITLFNGIADVIKIDAPIPFVVFQIDRFSCLSY